MPISIIQKSILSLLADGEFHSGEALSDVLGVSRSAVWKHLNSLSELGLEHSAVSGKGYRLERPLELLRQDEIEALLSPEARSALSVLEIHDQLDSTNSYLVDQAHSDAPSGSVCLAEFQSAGRGRRGRFWVSPFGCNIYLSILWRFQNGPAALSGLSLAIGVAVVRALRQQGIAGIGLKWPNDIYWQGQKLGGILVEVSGEANGPCTAVTGLGLNLFLPVQQAASITQAWTDLSKVTGQRQPPRNQLVAVLLNHLLPVMAEFETTGIAGYIDEWRGYDCLKGQSVRLYMSDQQITGIAQGIDDQGLFVLKTAEDEMKVFASGEVSFNYSIS
ncbi:MAG: bifunctional biotin--[acetyl-CoA-carboxylase] ligase/biotin operon repressor BirA [Gammaproteobacteria bacterium]